MLLSTIVLALVSVTSAAPALEPQTSVVEARAYDYQGIVCRDSYWKNCFNFSASPNRCEALTGQLHDTMTSFELKNDRYYCIFYKDRDCTGQKYDARKYGRKRANVGREFNDFASSVWCHLL